MKLRIEKTLNKKYYNKLFQKFLINLKWNRS